LRAPPRLRGGIPARLLTLFVGLALFASGIALQLESKLGLSPWDVLHQGIARHTPLSFGVANIAVGACAIVLAWRLGAQIGFATIANGLCVGAFLQLLTSLPAVTDLAHEPLGVRIVLLGSGIGLMGLGTGLYIGAAFGAGPRDSLMVVGARRTGLRIGIVRAGLELAALGCGAGLGGTIGLGTLAFALLIGPAVEATFWLLERSTLALA